MNAEERIAELEAMLRRTQEFVGTETQAESRGMFTPTFTTANTEIWPFTAWPTGREYLRTVASTLDRRDALIVAVREALGQARHQAARITTWAS